MYVHSISSGFFAYQKQNSFMVLFLTQSWVTGFTLPMMRIAQELGIHPAQAVGSHL